MAKLDDGPCFNWSPRDVGDLDDDEVELYYEALKSLRKQYKDAMEAAKNQR